MGGGEGDEVVLRGISAAAGNGRAIESTVDRTNLDRQAGRRRATRFTARDDRRGKGE